MIVDHEIFRVPDEGKRHEILLEVNWEPKNPKTNNCQLIRVTLPSGEVIMIRKDYIMSIMFALGNEEEQRKLIPKVERKSRWYETVVSVEANKDIKKGENITFPIKLTLPTFDDEIIAEVKKEVQNKDGFLVDG